MPTGNKPEKPKRTGSGSYENAWGWIGTSLDGHRIKIDYDWDWYLAIELTTHLGPTWIPIFKERDASLHMFGYLTGLIYKDRNWWTIDELKAGENLG